MNLWTSCIHTKRNPNQKCFKMQGREIRRFFSDFSAFLFPISSLIPVFQRRAARMYPEKADKRRIRKEIKSLGDLPHSKRSRSQIAFGSCQYKLINPILYRMFSYRFYRHSEILRSNTELVGIKRDTSFCLKML